jgi:hypothetical protein
VCRHVDKWPMDAIDCAVLAAIAGDVLDPALAEDVVQSARELHEASIAAFEGPRADPPRFGARFFVSKPDSRRSSRLAPTCPRS